MRRVPGTTGPLLAIAVVIAASLGTSIFAQGASRTRPSGGSGSSRAMSSSAASGRASHGTPSHASGRATHGYRASGGYHGGYYGGYYGGHYGYYGWGYPYRYGYWGSPWFYGAYAYSIPQYLPVASSSPASRPAVIETTVKPKKAEVFLDGKPIGQARDYNGSWDVLYVRPGRHELEFRKDGLMTLHYAVDLSAGGYYRIDEKMQKGEGQDPRSVLEFDEPAVSPAPAASFRAEIVPGNENNEAPRSNLRSGFLRLDVFPADASVYLDGEFLAQAGELSRLHGALPVAAGGHRVEVVRPGFLSQTQRIEVQDGEVAEAAIRLIRAVDSP